MQLGFGAAIIRTLKGRKKPQRWDTQLYISYTRGMELRDANVEVDVAVLKQRKQDVGIAEGKANGIVASGELVEKNHEPGNQRKRVDPS